VNGTYALTRRGERGMTAGLTREDAERRAVEYADLLPGPPFEVVDLLPELELRFPVGASVWLGPCVHWRRGQAGTVAAGEPGSCVRWQPGPGPVPWFIGLDGPSVYVRLADGSSESWWPSGWLETREATVDA
jgi:hypothetical protein